MTPFRVTLCLFFYFLSLCNCSIRLGSLLSESDAMPQQKAAILLALNHINNKTDGIHDDVLPSTELLMTMRVVDLDILTVVETSKSLAMESYSGQGVTAVIGPDNAVAAKASRLVFSHAALPQLHYGLGLPSLSEGINHPYFTRISASDAMQGHPLVEVLEHFRWKHVFVVYSVDEVWQHAQYNFIATAEVHGINILGNIGITNIQDVERAVCAIRRTHSRIIVLLTNAANAAEVIQLGYEVGVLKQGMQLIGGDGTVSSDSPLFDLPIGQRAELLKGYIGLQQRVYLSEAAEVDFVTRWRSQPATRIDYENGSVWCSNITDDDGKYIYYDPSAPQNCSGLDFSLFAEDGSDIHSSAILAYDATVSLALAMHNSLMNNKSLNLQTIYNSMIRLSFEGMSGKICFSEEFASSRYGLGDRHCGIHYEILQYFADHDGFEFVAEWSSDKGYFHCSEQMALQHGHDCAELDFNNRDPSRPPADGPSPENADVDEGFEIVLTIVACFGITCIAIIAYVYLAYSKRYMIRLSQPVLCYCLLVGALCGFLRALLSQFHKTDELCSASMWLSHMCFVIIYSTLIVKTWKVHRVMNSGMKKVRISSRVTLLLLLGLVCVPVLLLLAIQISHPPTTLQVTIVSNQEERLIDEYCEFGRLYVLDDILYVYEFLLLLGGVYLTYATRRIPTGVSDSSKLRQMVVTVLVVCGGGAVVFIFDVHPYVRDFIISLLFCVCVLRCLYLFFGEVAYRALLGYDIRDDFVSYIRVEQNKYFHKSTRGIVPINNLLSHSESQHFKAIRRGAMTEKQALAEIQKHEVRLRLLQNFLLSIQADKSENSSNSNEADKQLGHTVEAAGDSSKEGIDTNV